MPGSSPSQPETPTQQKIGIAILGALCIAIVFLALSFPWSHMGSVDGRTYFEMIQGIADHGLPSFSNGPVGSDPNPRFPGLRSRYHHARDGELWGDYPPVYPYLMAPVYRLGGLTLVIQMTMCTLIFLVFGVFLIGRELTQSSLVGAAAAFLSLTGNAVLTKGFIVSSYTLATTFLVWSVFLVLTTLRERPQHSAWIFLAGFIAGLAVASHLIVFLMALGLVAALVFSSRKKAFLFIAGFALPMVCLAFFNNYRFDSYNPISYGPCPWRECEGPRGNETAAHTFLFALPVVIWAIVSMVAAWIVRKKSWGIPIVASLASLALVFPSILQERVVLYARTFWIVVVDANILGSVGFYDRSDDGLGIFRGRFVLKTLFQSTPAACLALPAFLRPTKKTLLLCLPVLGLIATILLRANLHPISALGHSGFSIRYLSPAIPLIMILVVLIIRELEWKRWHLVAGLLVSVSLTVWLASTNNDRDLFRRIMLLIVPLVLCFFSLLTLLRLRWKPLRKTWMATLAVWLVTATLAWGVGVNVGVDVASSIRLGMRIQNWHRNLEEALPERLAVLGQFESLNRFLALKDTKDIEYANLFETKNKKDIQKLVFQWNEDKRPVYLVTGRRRKIPTYPGIKLRPVEEIRGLYKVSLH